MAADSMIRCDREGISGVVSYDQTEPGRAEYAMARQWFMAELTALAETTRLIREPPPRWLSNHPTPSCCGSQRRSTRSRPFPFPRRIYCFCR